MKYQTLTDFQSHPPAQSVWLIVRIRHSEHITDVLVSLHWLRAPERISSKSLYSPYTER